MTNISLAILIALCKHKEIHGTENFAEMINVKKEFLLTNALLLAKYGLIEMVVSHGGRGHKTIYRDRGVMQAEVKP